MRSWIHGVKEQAEKRCINVRRRQKIERVGEKRVKRKDVYKRQVQYISIP